MRFASLLAVVMLTFSCAAPPSPPPADQGDAGQDDGDDPLPPTPIDVHLPPIDIEPTTPEDTGGVAWIVAHPDDDLLFMNPDVAEAIDAHTPSTTIVMTAGDAGDDGRYWSRREQGLIAAYAKMAGTSTHVVPYGLRAGGNVVHAVALEERHDVRIVFLRLPDGGWDPKTGGGDGFPRTHGQSLEKLLRGRIDRIDAVDHVTRFTRAELTAFLSTLIVRLRVARVATLEPSRALGFDHSDHHAAATFAIAAARDAKLPFVEAYRGYSLYDQGHQETSLAPNLTGAEKRRKRDAFLAYCPFDNLACPPIGDYAQWLLRRQGRSIQLGD